MLSLRSIQRGRQSSLIPVALFTAICLRHFGTLTSPPTKDQALGIWMEANFLAETRFDYASLALQEGELQGGPRLYVVSLLPSLLAATMLATSSATATIIAYHLFTYACATTIAVVVYSMIHRNAGALPAWLIVVAMLTTPLFSAQTSLCGMEIPLAMFSVLAANCVWNERYALAGVPSLLAFFVKISGTLVTLAILTYLIVLWISGMTGRQVLPARRNRNVAFGILIFVTLLVVQIAIVALAPIGLGQQ